MSRCWTRTRCETSTSWWCGTATRPLRPRRRRAAGGPVRQLCRRDGCPLSHRPQPALGRSPGDGTDRGRAGGRMEPVRLASGQASCGDAPAAVSAGGEHPALGGLAGGHRRVPGQVRGTAGEGGGHAGQPAGAGRLAGGARGTSTGTSRIRGARSTRRTGGSCRGR